MDTTHDKGGEATTDELNRTPILTPKLNDEEAAIVAEYCRRFRASKGPAVLVLAVQAMRAAIAQQARVNA